MILWVSVVTILASSSFRPPSREAISLVCEAVPGTKGALRKRKVHGWTEREEGGREGGRWSDHRGLRELRNAMLVKNTVERIRGNSIRYSFILPRSIYRIAPVSSSYLFLPSCKKRGKTETDRGRRKRERERLYLEKREAEEREER